MAVVAQHRVTRDQVIWAFGPDLQPVLDVEPGAVITLETNDCFLAIGDMHASMGDANICQACRPQPFSTIARIAIPKISAAPKPFS